MAKGYIQNKANLRCIEWLETKVNNPELGNPSDIGKIYLWVLCYKKRYSDGIMHAREDTHYRWRSFCIHCWDLLPSEIGKITYTTDNNSDAWSDPYKDLIHRFNEWFDRTRKRLEMNLAQDYFVFGKNPNLEILKRRFRSNWGDKENRTEVKVNNNSETKDTTLEIVIGETEESSNG